MTWPQTMNQAYFYEVRKLQFKQGIGSSEKIKDLSDLSRLFLEQALLPFLHEFQVFKVKNDINLSLCMKKDQVFKFTKKNVKFGLVIENYEAVNSTDEEFEDSLKLGEIRVAWYPEGKEEILPESNVSENFLVKLSYFGQGKSS